MFEVERLSTRRHMLARLGAGTLFLYTGAGGGEAAGRGETGGLAMSRMHVARDGTVTVLTGKVECGQGIRTTLAQVAAEELEIPVTRVRLVMGDTAMVPDDGGTWGSLTTPETVPVIRQACAAMRELLRRTAAERWHVDPNTLRVAEGSVAGQGGATYSYVDLAAEAKPRKGDVHADKGPGQPKDSREWKVCGTPVANVNGPGIVAGSHQYSSDIFEASMLHGRMVRPPNHHCRLVSFDAAKAEAMAGVRVVRDGDFLGVTAPSAAAAQRAAAAIDVRWSEEGLGDASALFRNIKEKGKPPKPKEFGRYPAVIESQNINLGTAVLRTFESSYRIAPIAHVPLEARTAVAQWQGDRVTVRCGTQAPFLVRAEIAKATGVPAESVRVIVSDTGSGYGAKHNSECELECARLARGVDRPVRLAWTREEEFTQSYSRPAAVIEVSSAVSGSGKLLSWRFHNYNGGAASLKPPYDCAGVYAAYHESESPLRQGSYRSLAAVGNTFAREMQMDEIAVALQMDPLELRLQNITNARLRTVLEKAAERFGWGKRKSGGGVGYGLACNVEKSGHLALFTELRSDGQTIKLVRMTAAFDAGAVINPDILSGQVEGAIVQGIGGALFERLQYDERQIVSRHLAQYRVPRFSDVPEIEVELVDRRDVPSAGAGESPITAVAPSIGAALFAATGKRVRELPLLPALRAQSAEALA